MSAFLSCEHGPRQGRMGVGHKGLWAGFFCPWKVCGPVWGTEQLVREIRQLQVTQYETGAVWSERTRKLLALAVSTASEEEAVLALQRARESHRAERAVA